MRKVFMGSLAGLLMVAAPGIASAACNLGDKGSEAELAKIEGIRSGDFGSVRRDMRQLRGAAMVLQRYGRDAACQQVVMAMNELLRDPRMSQQTRSSFMNRPATETTTQDQTNLTTQSTTDTTGTAGQKNTTANTTQDTAATGTQDTTGTAGQSATGDNTQDMAATGTQDTTGTATQTTTGTNTTTGTGMMTMGQRREQAVPFNERKSAMSAAELIGSDLYGPDNDSIGEIEDVVVTADNKPSYALVSYGGFLGMGEERAAVPVSALRVSPDNYVFVNMSGDQLKAAPTLKRGTSDWWSNQAWLSENDSFYQSLR